MPREEEEGTYVLKVRLLGTDMAKIRKGFIDDIQKFREQAWDHVKVP